MTSITSSSQPSSPLPIVNILLLGDDGCGKSTFLSRLSLGQHQIHRQASSAGEDCEIQSDKEGQDHSISIESSATGATAAAAAAESSSSPSSPVLPELNDSDQPYIYTVRLGYRRFQLAFYDTSYPPQHWSLLNPDVVVLGYDVTSRAGLNRLKEWRKSITRSFQLRRVNQDEGDAENGFVEVDREKIQIMLLGLKRDLRREEPGVIYPQEAYRIAQEMHCDAYAECSAVTGELMPQVFEDIVRLAVLSRTEKKNEQGGCFIL